MKNLKFKLDTLLSLDISNLKEKKIDEYQSEITFNIRNRKFKIQIFVHHFRSIKLLVDDETILVYYNSWFDENFELVYFVEELKTRMPKESNEEDVFNDLLMELLSPEQK